MSDVHYTWNIVFRAIDATTKRFGGAVYDTETGKIWDCGQALVREIYGPDWSNDPIFRMDNEMPTSSPAPIQAVKCAQEWLEGSWPGWAVEPQWVAGMAFRPTKE